jgi:signal transduction histidine kinase
VTERRRTDYELTSAKEAAESANKAKSAFLANMSHELRTPLHGILSFSRFGLKKWETVERPRLRGYFEQIQQSGETLLALLNDLLDLAKLESGKMQCVFRSTDLRRVAFDIVDEFRSLVSDKGLKVEFIAPSEALVAEFDPDRMKQVLRNLMSNAVKFSPIDGTITVCAERLGDTVRFTVRDQGPGIPADELQLIFDEFVQSSKTKSGAGGTGLGLAISRQILIYHSGKIWAENNPDTGATLFVEFPVRQRDAANSDDERRERSNSQGVVRTEAATP